MHAECQTLHYAYASACLHGYIAMTHFALKLLGATCAAYDLTQLTMCVRVLTQLTAAAAQPQPSSPFHVGVGVFLHTSCQGESTYQGWPVPVQGLADPSVGVHHGGRAVIG